MCVCFVCGHERVSFSYSVDIKSLAGRELRVDRALGEGAKFVRTISVNGGCVQVALSKHDDAHVCVQIDASRLGACKPEVNEVTEPSTGLRVLLGGIGGHEQSALSNECLAVGRHVREVVSDDEHLYHCVMRVEQRHLYCSCLWNMVTFHAKVNMTQIRRDYFVDVVQ